MKAPSPNSSLGKFLAGNSKEAKYFLDQFKADNLKKILKDLKGKPLDLQWYVQQQLESLDMAEKASERAEPLDKLKDLIILAASQDEDFQKSLSLEGPKKVLSDPFKGETSVTTVSGKPELKLVKAG